MRVAVIGGGAAGFFAAINICEMNPEVQVTILESAAGVLSKVKVSGGGRCNLTNSFKGVEQLAKIYPRGERVMRHALKAFSPRDTYEWFEAHGIRLTTQEDGCVFPASQSSQEIIDKFLQLSRELGIEIRCRHKVLGIKPIDNRFTLTFDGREAAEFDAVIITTGGSPLASGLSFIEGLPLTTTPPAPSLFSVKVSDPITELMGIVVESATVSLKGTKLRGEGALLITHWGMSGPAILKLSSYAARELQQQGYRGEIFVNWVSRIEEDIRAEVNRVASQNSRKLVSSAAPYALYSRLWQQLMRRSGISEERRWAELGSKGINRIVATLCADSYTISGKSTHAEEFVTCGGVETKCIEPKTMESRAQRGLYLAGEVLDVDAITGGFNLQAAWSMAYLAAVSIAKRAQEV